MNAVEYKAIQINKILKNSDAFKTYSSLKQVVFSKYKIKEDEIYLLQQQIVNDAYNNQSDFENSKKEYLEKKDKLYNDPILKKFLDAYKELQETITSIKSIIESGV